jgi:RNA polymerase sigma-70 factor (ECF subfamily)
VAVNETTARIVRLPTARQTRDAPPDAVPEIDDSAAGSAVAAKETLGDAYHRMRSALRAFLHRRTGDPQAADELVQEVWLRIADQADAHHLDNPEAWLQRIAANLALNWLKSHRFRVGLTAAGADVGAVADPAPDAERALHARRGLEHLRLLLEELPPRRRAVFLLYRGQGLSLRETADQLGISVKTAKNQMAEALDFLRRRMGEAGLWP